MSVKYFIYTIVFILFISCSRKISNGFSSDNSSVIGGPVGSINIENSIVGTVFNHANKRDLDLTKFKKLCSQEEPCKEKLGLFTTCYLLIQKAKAVYEKEEIDEEEFKDLPKVFYSKDSDYCQAQNNLLDQICSIELVEFEGRYVCVSE